MRRNPKELNLNNSLETKFSEQVPQVTIIMPIRNEEQFIEMSIGAVLAQKYPADKIELLIVDGMSTDRTREIIKKVIKKNKGINVKLVDNKRHIFSTGFNAGLDVAKGKIIFMIGGHTEIAPDYVRRCVRYLKDENIDCVGGCIETVGKTVMSRAISAAMSATFGVGDVAFRTGTEQFKEVDTVAFGAYKASVIEKSGFIDEEMIRNQDDEFNYRIRKLGGRIFLAPDVRCRYYSRSSILSLWRQYFRYGFWKVRVLQKHPGQMRPRHFAPPVFVAVLFSFSGLAIFFGWAKIPFAVITVSYFLTNILASIICAYKNGWQYLPMLPIIFATLHFSYGSGFLIGLIRFLNRWGDTGIYHRSTESSEKLSITKTRKS